MQQALGLFAIDVLAHGDELFLGHQLVDWRLQIGREAHVAMGENADELAFAASVARRFHDGNAGDLVLGHQLECGGERGGRFDGDRVHHHAGFKLLHRGDLVRLLLGREITMNDADAAGLGNRDGETRFSHRVHGG